MQVVKERLAKLLATENIHVRHSVEAKTASFDVKLRILTLPVWIDMEEDLYDMLTGHEVGHALFTPSEGWRDAVDEGVNANILNIVEDPRIERKIQVRYPGLRKAFVSGYRNLLDRDFFGNNIDLDSMMKMNPLDRLNMYFKLGASFGVPFASDEAWMIKMVESVDTWEDCVEASKVLQMFFSQYLKEELTGQFDAPTFGVGEDGDPQDGEESSDLGQALSDMLQKEVESDSSVTDSDEQDEGDTTGGYDSKGFDKENDYVDDGDIETQEAYNQRKGDLADLSTKGNPEYFSLPEANLKTVIVPYKKVLSELATVFEINQATADMTENNVKVIQDYNKFRTSSNKIINYMVKEFERKKAADEYKRTSVAKTGILNVNKLHQYKFNDDLFLKRAIVHDGKNHGLVIAIDWSGSMYSNLGPTFKQLANLVWFCNKVNIPFEVYAFTNSYCEYRTGPGYDPMDIRIPQFDSFTYKDGDAYFDHSTLKLLNLLSSRMTASELQKQLHNLWIIADHARNYGRRLNLKGYDLGSTPLVEAMIVMQQIIPNFKAHYKLDKVNFICLTDGDGNTYFGSTYDAYSETPSPRKSFGYKSKLIFEDPKTRKTHVMVNTRDRGFRFRNLSDTQANFLVGLLKDRYGINSIGIFLDGWNRNVSRANLEKYLGWFNFNKEAHQKVRRQARTDGFATVTNAGWDEYYIVPTARIEIRDDYSLPFEDGALQGVKVGKLKSIFAKNQKQKFGNRIMVNRIMDLIT